MAGDSSCQEVNKSLTILFFLMLLFLIMDNTVLFYSIRYQFREKTYIAHSEPLN